MKLYPVALSRIACRSARLQRRKLASGLDTGYASFELSDSPDGDRAHELALREIHTAVAPRVFSRTYQNKVAKMTARG